MEPFHIHRDSHRFSLKSGFTLIELMVVFVIITIITTVAITSQSTFNKTLILANTAYDIALTLRSAQSFGIGSRATALGTANVGYGLHFDTGSRGSFILFADTNSPSSSACHRLPSSGDISAPDAQPGNCVYDGVGEWVQTYTLGNGITVSDLCANSSCGLPSLDIVFARPNPDVFISVGGSYPAPPFSIKTVCLKVTSPQGGFRYISVASSGQIIANATQCP